MPQRKPYPTEIAAYAGFDQNGRPAWGTIRPTREACAAEVARVAPAVEGFLPPLSIFPVFIGLDVGTQPDLPLAGP